MTSYVWSTSVCCTTSWPYCCACRLAMKLEVLVVAFSIILARLAPTPWHDTIGREAQQNSRSKGHLLSEWHTSYHSSRSLIFTYYVRRRHALVVGLPRIKHAGLLDSTAAAILLCLGCERLTFWGPGSPVYRVLFCMAITAKRISRRYTPPKRPKGCNLSELALLARKDAAAVSQLTLGDGPTTLFARLPSAAKR